VVADALRGERPGDLARMISSSGAVFRELASNEAALSDLVTNLNVTAGAFASESQNLSRSIELLDPTLNETESSLAALNDALPPLRVLATEAQPSFEELPDTIQALEPWLEQTALALRREELGGTASFLRQAAPGLAQTAGASRGLFQQSELLGLCSSQNLVPTADTPITNDALGDAFETGEPNYQELFYGVVNLVSAGQPFDGNGPYLRLQPGGGNDLVYTDNPGGEARNTKLFAYANEVPDGNQPVLPDGLPAFRMDVPCHTNDVPDLNGPASAPGPSDFTPVP
ncbi:MAG: hypothetical protein M3Y34_05240, partial [Actinomycetota bacterium]|nr:hypothetical protein [Actinomycetota bacterium]